ncbi:MAG: VOC family protein [Planctomycetota bacterium]|jgi:catechol 2,3-dioxygenase-like lactoylglutathione lyase family enzyme
METKRVMVSCVSLLAGLGILAGASIGWSGDDRLAQSGGMGMEKGESSEVPPARRALHGVFTGDAKVVFYVSDVLKSVEFYRGALGFTFHHFHDYTLGKSVTKWSREEPPIYAEMSFAGRRFGLHLPQVAGDHGSVGKMKIYFRVKDLDAHHRRVHAWGGRPGTINDKPWMKMFRVTDPDGHQIYFALTEDAVHGNPWYGK